MALTQGERSLHRTQFGQETAHGTAVPTTARLPGFSSGIVDIDRSPASPNEDYGVLSMNQPGRGYYGVRLAKFPFRGDLRYEDFMHHLGAAIAGGVTPTTVATGVYLWAYTMDDADDTLDSKTIQEGDNIQAYQMAYGLIESLRVSFATLLAPGNAPWQVEANYIGRDKSPHAFDSGAVAVATAETAMGHLTRCYLGSTGTAFASLSEEVGLIGVDLTIPTGVVPRKYGGVDDLFDTHGRAKIDPTGTIAFYQTAAAETDIFLPFQTTSSPVMTEKRMRVQAKGGLISGSYYKTLTIDARMRMRLVPVAEDANGATVYQANVSLVKDATLGGALQVSLQNGIATLP